ncbi:hypothetical protein CSKR_113192 [Clonorchis sinensis]|uniref:Uncharacterized protein n=1 Tax=Clonorchis sinensis TaxID=79923 RepID=A0A8T1LZ68_CLOSI|nr:hypothetical protein CSKR_113192 [Clonorchis sinensis]
MKTIFQFVIVLQVFKVTCSDILYTISPDVDVKEQLMELKWYIMTDIDAQQKKSNMLLSQLQDMIEDELTKLQAALPKVADAAERHINEFEGCPPGVDLTTLPGFSSGTKLHKKKLAYKIQCFLQILADETVLCDDQGLHSTGPYALSPQAVLQEAS